MGHSKPILQKLFRATCFVFGVVLLGQAFADEAVADQSSSGSVRIATYNAALTRSGPGLLLRDILSDKDPQIRAVLSVITHNSPDILVLQNFDYDLENHALNAFQTALSDAGHTMAFALTAQPNSGLPTGLDMDGNGRKGEARDSQGYGHFIGQGGMAILSTLPFGDLRDFSQHLWKDLPQAILPTITSNGFSSEKIYNHQRLSSVAHWDVEILRPNRPALHLLAFHATTPVFDGDEDRNGRRNHDEILFWSHYLNGNLMHAPPTDPVVIIGDANLDPIDGEGRHGAIQTLLHDPRLQDTLPHRQSAPQTAQSQNTDIFDTVDWPDPTPGDLRISYILPDRRLHVRQSGVLWPMQSDPFLSVVNQASAHRLVWIDIDG